MIVDFDTNPNPNPFLPHTTSVSISLCALPNMNTLMHYTRSNKYEHKQK